MTTQRPNILTPAFQEGYFAVCKDPGYLTATLPDVIPNPYPAETPEHDEYRHGYETAVR